MSEKNNQLISKKNIDINLRWITTGQIQSTVNNVIRSNLNEFVLLEEVLSSELMDR